MLPDPGDFGDQGGRGDFLAQQAFIADQHAVHIAVAPGDFDQGVGFPPVARRVLSDPGAGHDVEVPREGNQRNIP